MFYLRTVIIRAVALVVARYVRAHDELHAHVRAHDELHAHVRAYDEHE